MREPWTIDQLTFLIIGLWIVRVILSVIHVNRVEDRIKRLYAEVEKIKKALNVKD